MYYRFGANDSELYQVLAPNRVEKRWGEELTYFNEKDKYCLKTLTILPNQKGSMHFHLDKHETLYVAEGPALITIKDPVTTIEDEYLVQAGKAFVIPPGAMHRLEALENKVLIIEASTYDNNKDSIRVAL